MNNIFRKFGSSAGLLLVLGTVVAAKEWRGIVPLESTRADVERLLGVQQSSKWASYYNLSREIVVFHFQSQSCDGDMFGLGWNVPAGTVVGIGIIPKGEHRKEEYSLPSNSSVQDSGGGFIYYSDNAAGVSIETYKNLVTLVDYYPGASQDNLRSPQIQECCFDFFPKFDEYQQLSFSDEKARLDNFLINMKERFGRGTIEVVGPTKRDRQNRMKLAERAKKYLVNQQGLEVERVLLVDGGFRDRVGTRLSLYSIGGLVSRIYLFPEKDPKKPGAP